MRTYLISTSSLTSKKLAVKIAEIALENKAENIVVLDMRKIVNFCDYFVICTGSSDRRIGGMADAIEEKVAQLGFKAHNAKAFGVKNWVLLDFGDVVIHIFDHQTREFYGLEYLWQDAVQVNWQSKKRPKK